MGEGRRDRNFMKKQLYPCRIHYGSKAVANKGGVAPVVCFIL